MNSSFKAKDFENLVKVYTAAIPLVEDFDDIHTLTGYTKDEVMAVDRKLNSLLIKNDKS